MGTWASRARKTLNPKPMLQDSFELEVPMEVQLLLMRGSAQLTQRV